MMIPELTPSLENSRREILQARGRESTCPLKAKAEQMGSSAARRGAHVGYARPHAVQGRGHCTYGGGKVKNSRWHGNQKGIFSIIKTKINGRQQWPSFERRKEEWRGWERGRGEGGRKNSTNFSFSSASLEGQTSLKIYVNLLKKNTSS